ncbi:ADP-ribose pyrophosphatase, mitochondrial [Trichonephila inaurata madagascariensis]|uniref:ADP-ribose pyrophosphatase, mitochondrial n=1 Tax=Trichonephila inaurata madagascariensis TaxID=2747483 RepID=A0A8X6M9F7_9ARAC|nr:ADP-ribose pyrophosphatase, mitochondrial [Trichonephila inaurata madagascariensis]
MFNKSFLLLNGILISVSSHIEYKIADICKIGTNSSVKRMNAVCRISTSYPVKRFFVPNDKVSWSIPFPDYAPPNYSAPHLIFASWADPDITKKKFKPKWNEDDDGRTGLTGRGRLGRWGPNHAGDAIVTRWKCLNGVKQMDAESGYPILQFVAILRSDCKKWAIPGGFVNPKETSSSAVLREFFEEAINIEKQSKDAQLALNDFFKEEKQVYKGYVDDPRNTDNAWIETTAINFHDENGHYTSNIALDARDDAVDVKWMDVVKDMEIYPPHYTLIEHLKKLHNIKS